MLDNNTATATNQPGLAPLTTDQRASLVDALGRMSDHALIGHVFISWSYLRANGGWVEAAEPLIAWAEWTARTMDGYCARSAASYRATAAEARALLATLSPAPRVRTVDCADRMCGADDCGTCFPSTAAAEDDDEAIRRADHLADVASDRKAEDRAERAKGGAL